MADDTRVKIVTGKVRFSFVHIFQPYSSEEGKPARYSMSVIIDQEDKATLAKINKAINDVAEASKGIWGGKVPVNLKRPLRDGAEKDGHEAYEGKMFLNATSKNRPGCVDKDLQEIIDPAEVKSGDYGRVSLTFFAYNSNGNKGIGVGLNNVQKLEDGDALGGKKNAASDFADEFGV
jgi:hypothetical protein